VGVDGRERVSDQATIWRWREAFQNDFAARMDWTIKDYRSANHRPVVVVNGQAGTEPIVMDAEVGKSIVLDAGGSRDPDGQTLQYKWFHYGEAGFEDGELAEVTIAGGDTEKAVITPTAACRAKWLPIGRCGGVGTAHIIVAVTDNGAPRLTSYRRVILRVHGAATK
jgi:hypothetical protein